MLGDNILIKLATKKTTIIRTDQNQMGALNNLDYIEVIAVGEDVKNCKVGDKILTGSSLVNNTVKNLALGLPDPEIDTTFTDYYFVIKFFDVVGIE